MGWSCNVKCAASSQPYRALRPASITGKSDLSIVHYLSPNYRQSTPSYAKNVQLDIRKGQLIRQLVRCEIGLVNLLWSLAVTPRWLLAQIGIQPVSLESRLLSTAFGPFLRPFFRFHLCEYGLETKLGGFSRGGFHVGVFSV